MEQDLPNLELRQNQVNSLMNWFGWSKAPFAKDFDYKFGVDLQTPVRKVDQLKQKVIEAKETIKSGKATSVTVEFPKITTDRVIDGFRRVGTTITSGEKVIAQGHTILPSTRELFQRTAEVLVSQFGFTLPQTVEPASSYPTSDSEVFVNLGDLSNRIEGKPMENVSIEVRKTS